MQLTNLTLHPVHFRSATGQDKITIHRSNMIPPIRLLDSQEISFYVDLTPEIKIPIKHLSQGAPSSRLPPYSDTNIYIVSRLVADMIRRPDFVFPYDLVRTDSGEIIGCSALAQFVRA